VSNDAPKPSLTPGRRSTLYATAAMPRSLILAYESTEVSSFPSPIPQFGRSRKTMAETGLALERHTLAKDIGSRRYFEATSSPTLLPPLESQVAFAPASTCALTL